jgi:hypothetical protein
LIFRAPNGYSLSMAVANSMRIFLLEKTAAAGNYVYFEDVILSQGPVTPDQRLARLRDQRNPAVYASLGISQHLNQGAANTFAGTVALAAGSATVTFPTAYNSAPVCAASDTLAVATMRVQTDCRCADAIASERHGYDCVHLRWQFQLERLQRAFDPALYRALPASCNLCTCPNPRAMGLCFWPGTDSMC